MPGYRNILVLHAGAIGDFLLALPALAALARRFPDAAITLAANPRVAPLVEELLRFRCIPVDSAGLAGLFVAGGPLDSARRLTGPMDLAVLWVTDTGGVIRDNLRKLGARTVTAEYAKPAPGSRLHASDIFLATISSLGCRRAGLTPYLVVPTPKKSLAAVLMVERGVDAANDPPVIVHPGSGSPAKNWPATHYARLITAVHTQLGAPVLLVRGYADDAACAELEKRLGRDMPPVLEDAPLDLLAAALSLGRLYIGNDSGVSHLASAIGARAVVIFGATDPKLWGPQDHNTRIVTGAAAGGFPGFESVYGIVRQRLTRHGGESHHRATDELQAES